MENLEIWEKLFKTDPAYTKKFDKGTYKGTAINPMYVYRKLTEQFGACGIGWKVEILDTQTQHFQDGAAIVSQTVGLFIKDNDKWSDAIVGTGGDYIRRITNNGKVMIDDDGYKKALTDAITNATKMLGMSGDVYMGLYDDNKYVQSLNEEFAEKENPEIVKKVDDMIIQINEAGAGGWTIIEGEAIVLGQSLKDGSPSKARLREALGAKKKQMEAQNDTNTEVLAAG
jgi:hypothetical protein